MGDPGRLREQFWLRKSPGRGLFWQRKKTGRAILAADKPWAGYFGCGKTWAGAILAAEKPCARAHSGNLTYIHCIFDTWRPSEEQVCEARIPEWVGPRTWNREVAGSIPGFPKVVSGSLFRKFWNVLGCVWEWFGTFSDRFGMVLKSMLGGPDNWRTKINTK